MREDKKAGAVSAATGPIARQTRDPLHEIDALSHRTAPRRRPSRDRRRRALLVAMGLLLAEEVAA